MTEITEAGVYDMPADEYERHVPVKGGYTALIDESDYALVAGYRWRALKGHNGKVYAYAHVSGGSVYMHRVIAGTESGFETDHVNGDGLDNRRGNLRTATASQNSANAWKPRRPDGSPHSSIFKGVSWDKGRGKWQAQIALHGRSKNLGRYLTEIEAARAYDTAALAQWGEFAKVNFPVDVAA